MMPSLCRLPSASTYPSGSANANSVCSIAFPDVPVLIVQRRNLSPERSRLLQVEGAAETWRRCSLSHLPSNITVLASARLGSLQFLMRDLQRFNRHSRGGRV